MLTFLSLLIPSVVAIGTPPAALIGWICLLCAAILAGIQRSWILCLIAAGFVFIYWPWGG